MGLVHSNGILANIPSGGSIFRLVSAMQMERFGIRYVAGSFDSPGYIECVRSGVRIPTLPKGDVLYVSTSGFADEIVPSAEFRSVVARIANGLESPLVDLTPFLLSNYSEPGESNRRFASQQVQLNWGFLKSTTKSQPLKVNHVTLFSTNHLKVNHLHQDSRLFSKIFVFPPLPFAALSYPSLILIVV